MREFITALCLVLGACASSGQGNQGTPEKVTAWRTLAIASAGADVGTTLIGQRSGAREQNQLLGQQPQQIVAVNAVILSAVWWLSHDLPAEQQVRVWKWVAALHLGAALWNGSQLKR
jgi:hypothetical protein